MRKISLSASAIDLSHIIEAEKEGSGIQVGLAAGLDPTLSLQALNLRTRLGEQSEEELSERLQ